MLAILLHIKGDRDIGARTAIRAAFVIDALLRRKSGWNMRQVSIL